MKLMTKELEAAFAKTGSQEHLGDNAVVIAKFFNPCGGQTWYATEYMPESRQFFGWVNLGDIQCAELGYFSLTELESVKIRPFGVGIERDMYWKPTTLAEVKKAEGAVR